jgi:predicted TIM-barrel fold metal-dependent hydrolase
MDRTGVDIQALTINGFWWYAAADRELARRIVHAQNEGLAKWVSAHPDRFVAMASVALQHPDLAAEQLQDGVKRLGLRGASIGGHVDGEDPVPDRSGQSGRAGGGRDARAPRPGRPVCGRGDLATSSATRSKPPTSSSV